VSRCTRIWAAGESPIRHHHVESQRSPTITPTMRTGISTISPSNNLNLEPFKKAPGALNLLLWAERRRLSNVWPPRLGVSRREIRVPQSVRAAVQEGNVRLPTGIRGCSMAGVGRAQPVAFNQPANRGDGRALTACCPMELKLPVVHRENRSVTGVERLLTPRIQSGPSAWWH
jgi:hypothetical protein